MKFIFSRFSGRFRLGALAFCVAFLSHARATTIVPPDFAQLVNESDYVVRGVVKSVNSQFETADSKKIITFVEIEVSEVVTGTPPQKVVLRLLGGKVGDDELVVEGAPQFTVGEENIIFVKGNGHSISPVYAFTHGRYRVLHDAAAGTDFVARDNRAPLHDTAEISQPMAEAVQKGAALSTPALTPAQFIQRIKQSVNPGYTRPAYAN